MAARRRRLGPVLSDPHGPLVQAALRILCATPAPHGAERPAAEAFARRARASVPGVRWEVAGVGAHGANVVGTVDGTPGENRPALLLVSHLDTSLSGLPDQDEQVTGRGDDPGGLRADGGHLSGFGLGVARGPAAAAVAGLAAAADRLAGRPHRPVHLLLAGSGTHRSALASPVPFGAVRPSSSAGALAHLATYPRPEAVLVAKCGPPAVLRAEPGACYLRLRVGGRWGAALAPGSADPPGGVLWGAGAVLAAVEGWRAGYVAARRDRADGLGGEVGLGALFGGRPDKPDLLPAGLELRLYVVTVPGDDPHELAAGLAAAVRDGLRGTAFAGCPVEAAAEPLHSAAATAADAPVVRAAHAAWRRVRPVPPAEIRDWTGSTDGVVFRAAGIDTVRVGPTSSADPDDPRRDRLAVADLTAFAELYADVAVARASGANGAFACT